MQIVMKRENGWWWADIDCKSMFAVAVATLSAKEVWDIVKNGNPEAKIGFESEVFGLATCLAFGPIVWMK